ncbi:uncharacterized protein LOC119321124 [Triticum dicoccoides]|uniref:uncharacterized protein LOC119321124 n=1 Tax=Triticum dicoccoides TaxID=85692 RepID=UPI001890C79F|nr:uncharacterized protein LOC119321124 [Triticum dicoccoides]
MAEPSAALPVPTDAEREDTLDRILMRLAFANDACLVPLLVCVLPYSSTSMIIGKLAVEILNHINERRGPCPSRRTRACQRAAQPGKSSGLKPSSGSAPLFSFSFFGGADSPGPPIAFLPKSVSSSHTSTPPRLGSDHARLALSPNPLSDLWPRGDSSRFPCLIPNIAAPDPRRFLARRSCQSLPPETSVARRVRRQPRGTPEQPAAAEPKLLGSRRARLHRRRTGHPRRRFGHRYLRRSKPHPPAPSPSPEDRRRVAVTDPRPAAASPASEIARSMTSRIIRNCECDKLHQTYRFYMTSE